MEVEVTMSSSHKHTQPHSRLPPVHPVLLNPHSLVLQPHFNDEDNIQGGQLIPWAPWEALLGLYERPDGL